MVRTLILGPSTSFEEGVLLLPTMYAGESLIYSIDYSGLTTSPASVSLSLLPNPVLPSDLTLATLQTASPFQVQISGGTSGIVYTLKFSLIDTSSLSWTRTLLLPLQ